MNQLRTILGLLQAATSIAGPVLIGHSLNLNWETVVGMIITLYAIMPFVP